MVFRIDYGSSTRPVQDSILALSDFRTVVGLVSHPLWYQPQRTGRYETVVDGEVEVQSRLYGTRFLEDNIRPTRSTFTHFDEDQEETVEFQASFGRMPRLRDFIDRGVYSSFGAMEADYLRFMEAAEGYQQRFPDLAINGIRLKVAELDVQFDLSTTGLIFSDFGLAFPVDGNPQDFDFSTFSLWDGLNPENLPPALKLEIQGTQYDDLFSAVRSNPWELSLGEGNDTLNGSIWGTRAEQDATLNGGEGTDVLTLVGRRDQWKIEDVKGTDPENPDTFAARMTHKESGRELILHDMETVEFSSKFNPDNVDRLSMVREAALWSTLAYRDEIFLPPGYEIVHAHELGLALEGDGRFGEWTFLNGVFKGSTAANIFGGQSAVAHIAQVDLSGGDNMLVVAFRGTDGLFDDPADRVSGWGPQANVEYFPAFKPLIDGLSAYLQTEAAPERVMITGHSLGGMTAQHAMDRSGLSNAAETTLMGYSFGSAGIAFGKDNDPRFLHVEHSDDSVPAWGRTFGFDTSGGRLVIPLNGSIEPTGRTEHSMEVYRKSLRQLEDASPNLLQALDQLRPGESLHAAAGTNGGDRIVGDRGPLDEILFGRGGRDTLLGQGGNDALHGGAKHDTLNGGPGSDDLYGGSGRDTFLFAKASHSFRGRKNRDEIHDMESGDKIDLSNIDADRTTPGRQAFTLIGPEDPFLPGTLRILERTDSLLVQANLNANSRPELEFMVYGQDNLAKDGFFLG